VSLDIATKKCRGVVHVRRAGGREFQILGAATLMLRAPLTVTPKSGDVALQMAPMLAADNIASTVSIQFGK